VARVFYFDLRLNQLLSLSHPCAHLEHPTGHMGNVILNVAMLNLQKVAPKMTRRLIWTASSCYDFEFKDTSILVLREDRHTDSTPGHHLGMGPSCSDRYE
jgi:hypothetical protein